MYYEIHITMSQTHSALEAVLNLKWKYSTICGDPDLGEDVFQYATKHLPAKYTIAEVQGLMHTTGNQLIELGHNVVRQKIELVVYDSLT